MYSFCTEEEIDTDLVEAILSKLFCPFFKMSLPCKRRIYPIFFSFLDVSVQGSKQEVTKMSPL